MASKTREILDIIRISELRAIDPYPKIENPRCLLEYGMTPTQFHYYSQTSDYVFFNRISPRMLLNKIVEKLESLFSSHIHYYVSHKINFKNLTSFTGRERILYDRYA